MIFDLFITLFLLSIFINTIINLKYLKKPEYNCNLKKSEEPFVSILVPVRNEAHQIKRCLKSLLNQKYSNFEIIALDDNSDDSSYEIMLKLSEKHKNLKLLKGEPLPDGWTGKNFACYQLSKHAKGEWLLFTDADTIHHPNSLMEIISLTLKEKLDFVSVIPYIITKNWADILFMPLISFSYLAFIPLKLINKVKDSRLSLAIGPYMLLKKDIYEKSGGHYAIKDEIVDDLKLVRLIKANNGKIELIDGSKRIFIRFYKTVKELWDGFSKNAFGAFEYSLKNAFIFLGINSITMYYPYLALWKEQSFFSFAFFQVLILTATRLIIAHRFRLSKISAILHPIGMLLGILICLNSIKSIIFKKGVEWKTRFYYPGN